MELGIFSIMSSLYSYTFKNLLASFFKKNRDSQAESYVQPKKKLQQNKMTRIFKIRILLLYSQAYVEVSSL